MPVLLFTAFQVQLYSVNQFLYYPVMITESGLECQDYPEVSMWQGLILELVKAGGLSLLRIKEIIQQVTFFFMFM